MKYTPDNITALEPHQIFVFGTNAEGRHGKGAALIAKQRFGAIQGQAEGLMGQSYGIITKKNWRIPKSSTLDEIFDGLVEFVNYAIDNPENEFLVTKLGSSLAGYTVEEIKDLWAAFTRLPGNIILPKEYEVR